MPAVKAFIDANPIDRRLRQDVGKRLPAASLYGAGRCRRRGAAAGLDAQLSARAESHRRRRPTRPTSRSGSAARSPTPIVGRFAAALVQSLQLGKHDGTDVLAISFSSPTSSAMRSARAATRSRTCTRISTRRSARCSISSTRSVGKDQWVAGLSADHGVTPIPEQLIAEGKDARPHQRRRARRCDRAGAEAGARPGHAMSRVLNTNDIYFEPGVYDKILKIARS